MDAKPVTIGLVSDTHAPARLKALPTELFEVLAGVDLILHSGDVGELWVLDQLSAFAPVIAVHGNDETAEATAALPYLQTVVAAGTRIVLTHSHYPARADEMESRKDNRWEPKLSRLADFGKQHGANIVVFGHTHIPMQLEWEGVLLINPGAIASGGSISRQTIRTVARLILEPDAKPRVEHINLKPPTSLYTPPFAYETGFQATHAPYFESIVDHELGSTIEWFSKTVVPLAPKAIFELVDQAAHRVWSGDQPVFTVADVVRELRTDPRIPDSVYDALREHPVFGKYV